MLTEWQNNGGFLTIIFDFELFANIVTAGSLKTLYQT